MAPSPQPSADARQAPAGKTNRVVQVLWLAGWLLHLVLLVTFLAMSAAAAEGASAPMTAIASSFVAWPLGLVVLTAPLWMFLSIRSGSRRLPVLVGVVCGLQMVAGAAWTFAFARAQFTLLDGLWLAALLLLAFGFFLQAGQAD